MKPMDLANAFPKKTFFIQMFTKDISLEDSILDLVDNSIDGLVRTEHLNLSHISKWIFKKNGHLPGTIRGLPSIRIKYSVNEIVIEDNCGGIDYDYALKEAFNFGHSPNYKPGYLGVYGIGLKRALFKIGKRFHITSKTTETGFTCDLEVDKWLLNDDKLEDWKIPLDRIEKAKSETLAGTLIKITDLHDEVKLRVKDPTFENSVGNSIMKTYPFFLSKYVAVKINDHRIEPFDIPVGKLKKGEASFEKFEKDGVLVRIFATVARPNESGRYPAEYAGWYIVCNGRVVLPADKSATTGWGLHPFLPQFVSKYRSFLGFVLFESKDPLGLPWTTTKRELNKESKIYQYVKDRMAIAARPVISFLNRKYPSDVDEQPIEREISKEVTSASLGDLISRGPTVFTPPTLVKVPVKTTKKIQYDAENSDLEKIRKHLRKPYMTLSEIGRYTFDYFLRQEGLK
jgi:hypothetical protein